MRVFEVEVGTRGGWEGEIVARVKLLRGRLSIVCLIAWKESSSKTYSRPTSDSAGCFPVSKQDFDGGDLNW